MKKTINGVEIEIGPWADLAGADLAGANLTRADLRGADLAGADLTRANLRWANLARANLRGADLSDAIGAISLGTPYSWHVVMVSHDDGPRISAGCRWFTMAKAREHWSTMPERKLMTPLLEYAESVAKIKGWPT